MEASNIEHVEESKWISPMVFQDKKTHEIYIFVDLRKSNDVCLYNPFPAPFTNDILESVGVQEFFSFIDGFLGYQQIRIAKEGRHKTTFLTECGFFQYMVMPFSFNNAPTIFHRIIFVAFKEFIHKFLEVYFDDLTVYALVKNRIQSLILMF